MKAEAYLPLGMLLLNGVLFHAMPRMSRRDIFFGITVPLEFTSVAEAQQLLFRYRVAVWIATLIGMILPIIPPGKQRSLEFAFGMVLQMAVALVAWINTNRKVRPHALKSGNVRVASLATQDVGWPGGMLFATGPVLILIGAAAYLYLNWERIPARFPVHFGLNGQADQWVDKSWKGVFGMLFPVAFVALLTLWISRSLLIGTRQVKTAGPPAVREKLFKRVSIQYMILVSYVVTLSMAGLAVHSVLWPGSEMDTTMQFINFAPIVLLLALMVWLIRIGQGGDMLAAKGEEIGESAGDATPDRCWKAGVIYYNPNDPALWVEKRMGIGWTLNFANWMSWVFIVVVAVVPLLMTFALR